jgi:hypothetical protein
MPHRKQRHANLCQAFVASLLTLASGDAATS